MFASLSMPVATRSGVHAVERRRRRPAPRFRTVQVRAIHDRRVSTRTVREHSARVTTVNPRPFGTADAGASSGSPTAIPLDKPPLRLVRASPDYEPAPALTTFLPSPAVLVARYRLSERETAVALLVVEGARNRDIAAQLGLSVHTVRRHVESLMKKLQVRTRSSVLPRLLAEGFMRS